MATYSVKINISSVSPSISQVCYSEDYYFNNYARLYVGDSFTVSTSKISGTITSASGFRYSSAVLSGFTQTSASAGTNTVYGMTGTLTADHIGEHYGTMALARKPGSMTTGGKFSYTVFGVYRATLAYNANGGSGAPSSSTLTQDSSSQTAPSIWFTISGTYPTRSNYTFKGWDTNSSASSAGYQPGGSIGIGSSLSGVTTTLYAIWWGNWYSILKYNANGGSGAPGTQSTNVTQYYQPSAYTHTISNTIPTREGKVFKGWATSSSATTPSYQPGSTISISYAIGSSGGTTLYAVWEDEKAQMHAKVSGTWKKGDIYVKRSGAWVQPTKVYGKQGGVWKEGA